ncbi:MAG TPA: serine hydrolase domain-containing protein [Vicinamibacterales bacterium]|nr:serine hydrolase domain-containing protein [Vicinamibacterales bacterium]
MTEFSSAVAIIRQAAADRAFPAAVVEVGRAHGVLWRQATGTLTYDPDAPPAREDTIFDLASLTKVMAATTLVMRAVDQGRLALDAPIATHFPDWRGADRKRVTVRDLLCHSAGLTAYLPFFRDHTGRIEYERAICTLPLEYAPRTRSLYSDLGFMLLGFLIEDTCAPSGSFRGDPSAWDPSAALAAQFRTLATCLTSEPLAFTPPRDWKTRTAPTEFDRWRGRLLVGEVHDENAWALGGAAGHAGLFGTAAAVGTFARAVLGTIAGRPILAKTDTIREFIARCDVPKSSRALGWDTMLPTSSCGALLSPTAIGHTGFTGTSLWIDADQDLYIVFLTNRVHPTRENEAIRAVRPRVHDAIVQTLQRR